MGSNQLIKGAMLCLMASIAWGAMFPVAERVLQYMDPFYFSFLRYASVSLLLLIWLVLKEGFRALRFEGHMLLLWFYGTMAFTIYNFFIFLGQHALGQPGFILASIMEALMPLISVLLLWMHKRVRPASFTLACIGIAFLGVLMVITKGDLSFFSVTGKGLVPVLIMFIAVFGWVIYSMGGQSFKGWTPLRYSTLSCLLGTITSGIIVLLMTRFGYLQVPNMETLILVKWEMAFMVFVAGLAALISWNMGMKILKPIDGILFINFVPVTTFIIAIFQGYTLTIFDIAGTVLIIVALISNNVFQRKELEEFLHKQLLRKRINFENKKSRLRKVKLYP